MFTTQQTSLVVISNVEMLHISYYIKYCVNILLSE